VKSQILLIISDFWYILQIKYNNREYFVSSKNAVDLSIENNFSGRAPTFYNSSQPTNKPLISENFVGNVKQGGSCNVPVVSLNIHCTGTHTECEGHVTNSNVSIVDVCPVGLIPAHLITVEPQLTSETDDSYHVGWDGDSVITKKSIQKKISQFHSGLIVRTTPNEKSKISRNYDEIIAPFFTNQAIDYIASEGVKHLLVDLPSVDKANDNGKLGNHKRFFKYGKTISELLFIEDSISDGFGFLQIQIPNWSLDAVPSRPIFYPV
tara:strand:- start:401 stop:1195 length:795 start_codon:yes stop_codon:yes gene_type:complete